MKKQNLLKLSIIAIILFAISCEAPKNSALRIKADQENAKVIIDGEKIGTVPLDVMVTSEPHFVEVILESSDTSNYYFSDSIQIAENVSKSLFAKLEIRYTEKYYWDNANTLEGIEEYKKQYPSGKRITQINEKIEEVYFEEIKNAKKISDANKYFKKYDSLYPSGKYIKEASEIVEKKYLEKIQNSKSFGTLMKNYNNYKTEFPTGKYIKEASEIVEKRYLEKIENSKLLGTIKKNYNIYKSEFPAGKYIQKTDSIINNMSGVFKDKRDGQTYKWVKIGKQIWMAENLNYKTSNSWCYNNSSSNCKKYGRLYTWEAAKRACPSGWHLPSDAEWTRLENTLGGSDYAGGKLKSTSSWKSPNKGASNSSGFSASPAGFHSSYTGSFYNIGRDADFWTSTPYDSEKAWHRNLNYNFGEVARYNYIRTGGLSVRCIRN